MPFEPDTDVFGCTLRFRVRGDDITGVADGANITTQWVDQVNSTASVLSNGSPVYVEDAYNGHAGVDFESADRDVLAWPLTFFTDGLMIAVVVAESDTGGRMVTVNLGDGTSTHRNSLCHRETNSNNHSFVNTVGSVEEVVAFGSTPLYTPNLQIYGLSFEDAVIEWHYDGSSNQEGDALASGSDFDTFDNVYAGDAIATGSGGTGQAFDGIILELLVWSGTPVANATSRADITRVLGDLDVYYNQMIVERTLTASFTAFIESQEPPPATRVIGTGFNAFVVAAGTGNVKVKRVSGRHIGKPV